jgi:hypothetical protein
MHKQLAALGLLLGLAGGAQAAIVTVSTQYLVDFSTTAVADATGLPAGSSVTLSATFDDANLIGNEVTLVPGSPTDSFTLNFGTYTFTAASDNWGGPVLQTQATPSGLSFSGLLFETLFNIGAGAATGEYLLSFSGTSFQLTPSGNTLDFVATGAVSAVPLPGVLPLLLAGLGGLGVVARRKKQ